MSVIYRAKAQDAAERIADRYSPESEEIARDLVARVIADEAGIATGLDPIDEDDVRQVVAETGFTFDDLIHLHEQEVRRRVATN